MKKNILSKIVFFMGVGVIVLTFFKTKADFDNDVRMEVQAVHTCGVQYFNGYFYCGGTCGVGYNCAGTSPACYCKQAPTPTIPSTCDNDGNGICSSAWPYQCVIEACESCPTNLSAPTARTKKGYCHSTSCTVRCSTFSGIPDSIHCGYCPATNVTPPIPTPGQIIPVCQDFSCSNVCGLPCSDGCGSIWGCDPDGYSCNSCGGGTPLNPTQVAATPTVNPGCTPTCENDPCRANTCTDSICIGSCGGNCVGSISCYVPVFEDFDILSSDQVDSVPDASNRSNICDSWFSQSADPRKVIFEASITDFNGYTDISSVQLRWNGNIYNMSLYLGEDFSALYRVTVDYLAGDNNSGTYPVEINVTDSYGKTTGWITTGREWKVWNCEVVVDGGLYDGSAGQVCNSTGFDILVGSDINYSSLYFRNAVVSDGVSMTTVMPNSYGPDTIIWGKTYLPIFNGGDVGNPNGELVATNRVTRIIDMGTGAIVCPSNSEFTIGNSTVSAYSAVPSAKMDFSFIRTQDGWFQVVGAGVKAKNQIGSGVPVTAPIAIRALTLSKALADNGLVSFTSFSNINGFNESSGYGLSNNWWINRNTNDSTTYNYQYFYNNLYVNRGLGTTGTDWISKPSEGIYYVNGNLTIDSNFTLAAGKTLLVVVRGTITISDTVDRVDGIFIADGGIIASGSSANQLVINGVLYSKGNIQLSRSYTNKVDNNDNSAVVVSYQPNLIFNLPGTVMRVLSGWKEE